MSRGRGDKRRHASFSDPEARRCSLRLRWYQVATGAGKDAGATPTGDRLHRGGRGAAAALAIVLAAGMGAVAARPPAPRAGQTAPDFAYRDFAGRPHRLSDGTRGHYVLLDFWASWCVPCRHEMATLRRAYASDHARGLDILGLNADSDARRALAFLRTAQLPWPQADGPSSRQVTHKIWNIAWLPTLVLLDPERRVVWVSGDGGTSFSDGELLRCLAGRPPPR